MSDDIKLSHLVNSPFIARPKSLIRIFSAISFFALWVISFLLTFFGENRKFGGGLEPFSDSLFRMYLLSHAKLLSISSSEGSGLHLLSRLPIALINFAVLYGGVYYGHQMHYGGVHY